MLTKRVIPCLDVKNGRVVKGLHFESIRDAGDPVELAQRYASEGADELVFLDITASAERRETIADLVSSVASVLDIPFTVGGGISTPQEARRILLCGADKVAVNTAAVKDPALITKMMSLFGRQCVVVAVDAKRNYDVAGGTNIVNGSFWFEVFTYGGRNGTGIDAIEWVKKARDAGAGEILLTSIDMDGTGGGYDLPLTSMVADAVSVPVIASGGCGSAVHMADVLRDSGADAALAASIFHYEKQGVLGVKRILKENGVPVRM